MPSYDAQAVKEAVDLVELAGADTQLRRVSGEEYAGPCPKCGGRDRFHVTPGWWFCRQCHERRGDAIGYVMWRDDVRFPDACEALGGERTATRGPRTPSSPRSAPPIRDRAAPGALWQDKARLLVAHCERELWRQPDKLAYLRGRGLQEDTIRAARLGWSRGYKRPAASWGLDPASYRKGIRIPRGWVIPCEVGGAIRYVKVRLTPEDLAAWKARLVAQGKEQDPPRYLAVAGGPTGGAVYGLDAARGAVDVVVCEGELNALTLGQALAGVAAAVSVGSASSGPPDADALRVLARAPRAWAAYDHDAAGEDGADKLQALWARVQPLSWPWADRGERYDLNDAGRDGEDLAAWAIPQLGPPDPDKRRAWLEHHLRRLDDAALEAGADDTDPALRAWLALWGELEALGPDPARRRAAQHVTKRDMAAAPIVTKRNTPAPGTWRPPPPAGDPAWPSDPSWPGEGWQECEAPEWAPPTAGHPRRWATNGAGRWVSRT